MKRNIAQCHSNRSGSSRTSSSSSTNSSSNSSCINNGSSSEGRDSSVGIATRYGMEGSGIQSR